MVELEQAVTEDVARYAATGAGESYFGSRIQDLVCARGAWLAALLVLQSASSVVLGKFEGLLQRHLALALFLTMLTGTAGNAGNQTSALVIRGLATGEIRAGRDWRRVLWRETRVALPLSIALKAAPAFDNQLQKAAAALTAAAGPAALYAGYCCLLYTSPSPRD